MHQRWETFVVKRGITICNAGFTFLGIVAIMMASLKHVLSCESRSYLLRSLR